MIINTHSPLAVAELPPDDLLMAQTLRFKGAEFVDFEPLWNTWRAKAMALGPRDLITLGESLTYLQGANPPKRPAGGVRVKDVVDLAQKQFELNLARP